MGRTAILKYLLVDYLPGTQLDIRARSGMSNTSVSRIIRQMHGDDPAEREVYIGGWHRPPLGRMMPIYFAGSSKDIACRLKRLTIKKNGENYRAGIKAAGLWEERKAKSRAAYWTKKAAEQGTSDPLMAAFFGMSPAVALSNRR